MIYQFIDTKEDLEEDTTLLPVKLPLEIKTEVTVNADDTDYTKVKVKQEPMDTFEDVKPNLPDISQRKPDELPKVVKQEETSCADLFTKNANSGKCTGCNRTCYPGVERLNPNSARFIPQVNLLPDDKILDWSKLTF